MAGALNTLLLIGVIGFFIIERCELFKICNFGTGGLGIFGGGGGGFGNGATAAAGRMIYHGTGRTLTGDLAIKDANQNYKMHSGNNRPSTRFIWGSGKGKGSANCVNYNSYEATVYATYGSGGSSNTRSILTGGGPGQRGDNCCVYSTGFVTGSGDAFAEEEGPHSPKPTIFPMTVQGGAIKNIGKLAGRTIGLKQVLIRNGGRVLLEGWVDKNANGNWELFYRAVNPHGGSLPVITKMPMKGENCGEVRFRTDGIWPVTLDTGRSFVAELPDNAQPATDGGNANLPGTIPTAPAAATTTTPAKKTDTKKSTKKKKSNYAYVSPSYYKTLYSRVAI